ncbi:hypothetical protein ACSBOB_14940 [Mesorhizobium sp. ASY16-5R]|uniref:hypothetical protein n=1 Tax=Mesorhizobium sp. ASY16-5R TaxID=3445772 RepID=UPI003F9EC9F8
MALLPETEDLIAVFTTPPSDKRIALINDTIRALMGGPSPTLWDKLDAFYVLAAHEPEAAHINWKSPGTPGTAGSYKLTPFYGPTFIPDVGYKGDGADAYIDTNLAGNDPAVFTTTSAVMGLWVHENPPGGSQYLIGQVSSSGERTVLAQSDATGSLAGRLGSVGVVALGKAPVNSVHLTVSRTDNTSITRYFNGRNAQAVSSASPTYSASNITLLSRGTIDYSGATISVAYFGSGLSAEQVAELDSILRNYLNEVQISVHPYATPEQFGAVGDADLEADKIFGTDDTAALDACRDYCAETGKIMLLTSRYKYVGTFLIDKPITVKGTNRSKTGIGLEIDRTMPGIHIMASNCTFEQMTVSSYSKDNIQNGQGDNATCFTVGRVLYSPADYDDGAGNLVHPPLLTGNVLRDMDLIRPAYSEGGHAIAYVGRVGGLLVEDILFHGHQNDASPAQNSILGDAIIAHWGTVADPFPEDFEGTIIHPLIMQWDTDKDPVTYHPNNLTARRLRLRQCTRLFVSSAAYNIHISDVDMDGYDDGAKENGSQILNLTVGDDADAYAHPDDKGKVYSNICVENVVGWNLDGDSPNADGDSLFDWPGGASSKYVNADGETFARDDIFGQEQIGPETIDPDGSPDNEFTVDITVSDDPTDQTPSCWYSHEDDLSSKIAMDATVLNATTIRVTFRNDGSAPFNLKAGTVTAFVSRQRLERQPLWTGCSFSNWRLYGLGGTEDLFRFRNTRAYAKFDNIDARALGCVEGLEIRSALGRYDFRDCIIPGNTYLSAVDGASFTNCTFENTDIVSLAVASAADFARGDVVQGASTQVKGTVYLVDLPNNILRVRLASAPWNIFSGSEPIVGGGTPISGEILNKLDGEGQPTAPSTTINLNGVGSVSNRTVMIQGDVLEATLETAPWPVTMFSTSMQVSF